MQEWDKLIAQLFKEKIEKESQVRHEKESKAKNLELLTPNEKRLLVSMIVHSFNRQAEKFFEEDLPNIIETKMNEILKEFETKLENIISKFETAISEKVDMLGNTHEQMIVVREIPIEEAKRLVEEFISGKKGEVITPLDIAENLCIPYEIAHEIFLQLIKEGKLEELDES